MTNLDSTLKSRDITLQTKVHLVNAMVFPVVMYRCESWTIKKAECWCFGTVVLEKTLESPLDCKEIQPIHPKGNQLVQSLSRVRLLATPWTAARQASLSITNSRSSLKLMSIELVMPSSYLILSSPSPPAPNPSQHQGLFKWICSSHQVAKVLEFQLQHQSFQWIPRTDLL